MALEFLAIKPIAIRDAPVPEHGKDRVPVIFHMLEHLDLRFSDGHTRPSFRDRILMDDTLYYTRILSDDTLCIVVD